MARRTFLFTSCVAFVCCLAALELAARVLPSPSVNGGRNTALGRNFADYAQLDADKDKLSLRYYDYDLLAYAPISTPTIDITDYHSSRLTPASVSRERAEVMVWTFGGSTMQDFETTDDLTIANTIAKVLAKRGLKARVENFGVSGFQSSLELVKFTHLLATVPKQERPHIALFYDGFNEAALAAVCGAGAIQCDISAKLSALVERRWATTAAYSISSILAQYSRLWRMAHYKLEAWLFPPPPSDISDANLARTVSIYAANVGMEDAICASLQIKCFFALQPLVVTKQPLGPIDQASLTSVGDGLATFTRRFYAKARERLADRPGFIDASNVLDNDGQDDFWDLGHTGPVTQSIIGRALAEIIVDKAGLGVASRR